MQAGEFLGALRGRLRRIVITDFSARFVALGFFTLLGFGTLDYLAANAVVPVIPPLPPALRAAFLAGWLVLMGGLCYRRLLRPLARNLSDGKLANLVERRLPVLDGRVFCRLDGIRLDPAAERDLDETLDDERLRFLAPGSRLKQSLSTCGLAVLIMLGLGVYWREGARTALFRFFNPLGSVEWPTRTTLLGGLDSPVVAADERLVVDFERSGEEARVTLSWTDRDGKGGRRRLDSLTGPWRVQLPRLGTGTYRIVAASGKKSNRLAMTGMVVPRPGIAEVSNRIVPPRYLEGIVDESTVDSLAVQAVVPGTRFVFDLRLDLDPDRQDEVVGVRLDGDPVEHRIEGDRLRGSFAVREPSELFVELAAIYAIRSDDGMRRYRIDPGEEQRFRILTRPDLPPTAQVAGVKRNEAVTPTAVLELAINAADDFALAEMALGYQILDAEDRPLFEERQHLHDFADVRGQAETLRSYDLALPALKEHAGGKVTVGRAIELQVRAVDGNEVTGPGVGRSDPLRLRVVSPEDLRAELGNLLHDAVERLDQAREGIAEGLSDAERLRQSCRGARIAARRAGELLDEADRRWGQNRLDPERGTELARAATLVRERGRPLLAEAGYGDPAQAEEKARQADDALGEAERILAAFLRDDDLVRDLRNLIKGQQRLHAATKTFLKRMLTEGLDQDGERRLEGMTAEQRELAERTKHWERRLLEGKGENLKPMQDTVRREQPAERLRSAAESLADREGRVRAPSRQAQALSVLRELLQQFMGSERDVDLARRLGELAAAEEDLRARLEAGEAPKGMAGEQDELGEDLQEVLEEVPEDEPHDAARRLLQAAREAQDRAGEQMRQGRSSGAARNAGAAAGLMREAQRELDPNREESDDREEGENDDPTQEDVIALLRELRDMQRKVVAGAILQRSHMAKARAQAGRPADDPELNFAERRRVRDLAEKQGNVRLRLREEGIKTLEAKKKRFQIAIYALKKVDAAVDAAWRHLDRPALGERGVRLTKIALHEIERLLAIVESMPSPEQEEGGEGNPGGGNQGQQRPPFPPRAQLALLRAEQDDIAHILPTSLPVDLTTRQFEVMKLTNLVMGLARPGTRADVLLQRAFRAMSSAAYELAESRRGTVARNEMDAALAALTRLIEEAGQQQGASGASQQRSGNNQQGRSRPQGADEGDSQGRSDGAAPAGAPGQGGEGTEGTHEAETNQAARGRWMHLPPQLRECLLEAKRAGLPPGVLKRFQTYLELLEDSE